MQETNKVKSVSNKKKLEHLLEQIEFVNRLHFYHSWGITTLESIVENISEEVEEKFREIAKSDYELLTKKESTYFRT